MTNKTSKVYAKIGGYGSLVVPMSLLERIVEEGYIVSTGYSTRSTIDKVEPVREVTFYEYEEIRAQLAQQALEGNQ